jgi:hypothetical protein
MNSDPRKLKVVARRTYCRLRAGKGTVLRRGGNSRRILIENKYKPYDLTRARRKNFCSCLLTDVDHGHDELSSPKGPDE